MFGILKQSNSDQKLLFRVRFVATLEMYAANARSRFSRP